MTQDTNTASGAAEIATRLRNACASVRNKSYPLADLIPLMQQAADALASAAAPAEQPAKSERWNPLEGGNPETALQMAAVIAHRDATQSNTAYAALPNAPTASDAMVDAYLKAQREAVEEADRFGRPNIGGLHTNTVREACRAGLNAALEADRASRGQAPAGWATRDPWREHLAEQADVIDCEALQRALVQHGISFPEGGMEHFRAALGEMVNRFVRFAAPAPQADSRPAPVLWVSPEQFTNFVDVDEASFGTYLPARKTSAGKFTMPLFAARAPADSVTAPAGQPYGIVDPDYARVFTQARIIAWQYGYACVMHGSFTRDLDLLLVPWTEQAGDNHDQLLKLIAGSCGLRFLDGKEEVYESTVDFTEKPHGRKSCSLFFREFGDRRWIDISIVPRPLYATPPAQAADSVLEDAAPKSLAAKLRERANLNEAPGNELYVIGLREAADEIDAVMAAKKGYTHE